MDVDVQRQPRLRMTGGGAREDLAHVGGPGESQQARPALQRGRQLGRRHPDVLGQPEDQPGVDAPRPRRHDQPVQGREAHRGVHRPPVPDGGQRGACPQVAGDDPHPVPAPAHDLRGPPRRVRVRQTVEAVPAEVPALAPLRRERVRERGGGQGRVEGGVEAGDGRDVREHGRHGSERGQGLRLVQGREVRERLQPLHDAGVDPDRSREDRPAVDDPVADGVHRSQAPDGVLELGGVGDASGRREIGGAVDGVTAAEHPQLEAGGSRVDDQDPVDHRGGHRAAIASVSRPRRTARPSSRSRERPRPRAACRHGPRCACPPSAGGRGLPSGRGPGRGR